MTEGVKKAKAPAKPKKTTIKKAEELKVKDPSHEQIAQLAQKFGLSATGRMDTQSRTGFEQNKSYAHRPPDEIRGQPGSFAWNAGERCMIATGIHKPLGKVDQTGGSPS